MFRYSVRDLLVAVAFLAAGLSAFELVIKLNRDGYIGPAAAMLICGGGLVGAGLAWPFKLTWIGALLGTVACLAIIGVIFVRAMDHFMMM